MLEISVAEVEKKLMGAEVLHMIDVREADEISKGAIPGVIHIPLDDLKSRLNELDRTEEYIVICRSGQRSEHATQYLESQGFLAKNMLEGMLGWTGPIVSSLENE